MYDRGVEINYLFVLSEVHSFRQGMNLIIFFN